MSRKKEYRISVIGTTGSGKTTTAAAIARTLGIPHIELDALNWGPNWTPAPVDVLRERVLDAAEGDNWVVDGNYSKVRDIVWRRASLVVWLDYALLVIFWQLLRRTLRRCLTREELWNGNRETLGTALLSEDSILLWALKTYRRRGREYSTLLSRSEYAHLEVVRLRSPRSRDTWLTNLSVRGLKVPSAV